MTYNVFSGILNPAQSISQSVYKSHLLEDMITWNNSRKQSQLNNNEVEMVTGDRANKT